MSLSLIVVEKNLKEVCEEINFLESRKGAIENLSTMDKVSEYFFIILRRCYSYFLILIYCFHYYFQLLLKTYCEGTLLTSMIGILEVSSHYEET